ncbi:MAG: c-type cytochrome [Verrucomicrobiota bacterium]|nr:c-type cytochrome [Verrucomicrobiota bacterium]
MRVLLLALLVVVGLKAQEEKKFYLPSNPVAAAYMLKRLSNQELAAAPRSAPVYTALLERPGMERKYRIEALQAMADSRKISPAAALIEKFQGLDGNEENLPLLKELAPLLFELFPRDLPANRPALEKLRQEGQLPLARQIGWAALTLASGPEQILKDAASPEQKIDLLRAIPLIPAIEIRKAFTPLALEAASGSNENLKMAAIQAIGFLEPGPALFNLLATFIKNPATRQESIASWQRFPKAGWPRENLSTLAAELLQSQSTVPANDRTSDQYLATMRFIGDLASLLPKENATAINRQIRQLGVQVIVIRTLHEQMLYDKNLIVVEAGKPVEIILENTDIMQHNLVLVKPGALEEIGSLAERMPAEPDAKGRLYVPDSPLVVAATRMLNHQEQAKLSFTAPAEVGDYPYVCTYPGHWRRMNGIMAVVKDVDAYLEQNQPKEQVITEWKLEDFTPDLAKSPQHRNIANGRELFEKTACIQCHKFGAEGYAFGPDLTDVFKRFNQDRALLLSEILEPSKKIEERYRNYLLELKDGESNSGMIVKEDNESITIHGGPSDTLITQIPKNSIAKKEPQDASLMPMGLLSTLSKEQILDLLAYLESSGKHTHSH